MALHLDLLGKSCLQAAGLLIIPHDLTPRSLAKAVPSPWGPEDHTNNKKPPSCLEGPIRGMLQIIICRICLFVCSFGFPCLVLLFPVVWLPEAPSTIIATWSTVMTLQPPSGPRWDPPQLWPVNPLLGQVDNTSGYLELFRSRSNSRV